MGILYLPYPARRAMSAHERQRLARNWDGPAGRIWALVSGMPSARARQQLFLMVQFQAYIDASGVGDKDALVMAGYIATAETWADFSDEWKRALDKVPLPYLKMRELARKRMDIAATFYRIIEQFDIRAAVSCIIPTRLYRRVYQEFAWPPDPDLPRLINPYYIGYRAIIENILLAQAQIGISSPIDFIFDDESEKALLVPAWNFVGSVVTDDVRPILGDSPIFRDDKKVLPLQAADMWAWWVLKWHRGGDAARGITDLRFAWPANKMLGRLHYEYTEAAIRKLLASGFQSTQQP